MSQLFFARIHFKKFTMSFSCKLDSMVYMTLSFLFFAAKKKKKTLKCFDVSFRFVVWFCAVLLETTALVDLKSIASILRLTVCQNEDQYFDNFRESSFLLT